MSEGSVVSSDSPMEICGEMIELKGKVRGEKVSSRRLVEDDCMCMIKTSLLLPIPQLASRSCWTIPRPSLQLEQHRLLH